MAARKKGPALLCKSERGEEVNPIKREHSIVSAWIVPPDDREGFTIELCGKSRIVISQRRPFEEKAEIILHRTEAIILKKILTAAITATNP